MFALRNNCSTNASLIAAFSVILRCSSNPFFWSHQNSLDCGPCEATFFQRTRSECSRTRWVKLGHLNMPSVIILTHDFLLITGRPTFTHYELWSIICADPWPSVALWSAIINNQAKQPLQIVIYNVLVTILFWWLIFNMLETHSLCRWHIYGEVLHYDMVRFETKSCW